MTIEELRKIIEDALAAYIVERVLQKLADRQKMALVVYTGSTIGFEESLVELRRLREEGFCFDALLTYSAAQILNVDKIKEALGPGKLLTAMPDVPPEQFAAGYPTILVPALTVYTAAHIATLTPESPAARAVTGALMRGKNVVVATDGCCPDRPERAAKGYRLTGAAKAQMRKNIEALRDYGAVLASSTTLCQKTMEAIGTAYTQPQPFSALAGHAPKPVKWQKRLVGRADVAALRPGTVVQVPKTALVTQLARDEAARRQVTIETE